MLSHVFSQYKDIVHVMPTKCLQSEYLFDITKCIIISLVEIGFQVLSIITDNNAINKEAISFFCHLLKLWILYTHSVMKSRLLFFLFDSVYILKCIRNDCLGQKDASKCMLFPKFCQNEYHELESVQSILFCTLKKISCPRMSQSINITVNWPQQHFFLLIWKSKILM